MLLMAAPFVSCGGSSDDNTKDVSLVPVKVSRDKWSLVNDKGEIFFEDEFESMPSLVYNGYFSVWENNGYSFYKVKGDKMNLVGDLEELASVGMFSEGLVPATQRGERIAVYDGDGKMKFELEPVDGAEIIQCGQCFSDGMLAILTQDRKIGYVDTKGKVVIEPAYDGATAFDNGLAIAMTMDYSDYSAEYTVIDKKGKKVFRLKDGQYPLIKNGASIFNNGYMIVVDDDRYVLYNRKGEMTKFPARIAGIENTDGKYIIFWNEDGKRGVADMEGEVVLKPKYQAVYFTGDGNFLAQKDDKEWAVFNTKGEEKTTYDYSEMWPFGHFGFFTYDGKRYSLVGTDDKAKGKDDFYEIDLTAFSHSGTVHTDYQSFAYGDTYDEEVVAVEEVEPDSDEAWAVEEVEPWEYAAEEEEYAY